MILESEFQKKFIKSNFLYIQSIFFTFLIISLNIFFENMNKSYLIINYIYNFDKYEFIILINILDIN